MYVSLNWQHGFTTGECAYENTRTNNIARIHYTTSEIDRIANIKMNSPYGFMELYQVEYGPYLIRMNCSQETVYTLEVPKQNNVALDLVSGEKLDLTEDNQISSLTIVIIYTGK